MKRYITVGLLAALPHLATLAAPSLEAVAADSTRTDSIAKKYSLKEVVVKASRITYKPNGFTLSMVNSNLVKGNTMENVLNMLPDIRVKDESISIEGKGVSAVYINNIRISDNKVLLNLQPDMISKVEVSYMNPGSEGMGSNGGVLRIWLKKEKGFQNTILDKTTYRIVEDRPNESIADVFYGSIGKLSIYNALSYKWSKNLTQYKELRRMNEADDMAKLKENTFSRSRNLYDWLSLSYEINQKQTIGISGFLPVSNNTTGRNTHSKGGVLDRAQNYESNYDSKGNSTQAEVMAFYDWQTDDKGSRLTVQADVLKFNMNNNLYMKTLYTGDDAEENNFQRNHNNTYMASLQANYVGALKGGSYWVGGIDYSYTGYRQNFINGINQPVVEAKVNNYAPAVYASYNCSLGEKWMWFVKLRSQYNKMNIDQGNVKNTIDYWGIEPSTRFTYLWNKKKGHSIAFSYSHTVSNVPYSYVSDFRMYDGDTHYTVGNPNLKKAYNESVSLHLKLFNALSVGYSFQYDRNTIYLNTETDPDNANVYCSVARNSKFGILHLIYAEWFKDVAKWWSLKLYAQSRISNDHLFDVKQKQFYWTTNINNTFRFTDTFGGGLSMSIDPKQKVADMEFNTVYNVDAYLYKTFFKDNLLLRLSGGYGNGRKITIDKKGIYSCRRHNDGGLIELAIQYTFRGGKSVKQRQTATQLQQKQTLQNGYYE